MMSTSPVGAGRTLAARPLPTVADRAVAPASTATRQAPLAIVGPPTLGRVIGLALARHPDVLRARAEIARSAGETRVAESALYPKVGYTSSFERSSTVATTADGSNLRAGLEVNQLVYDFGRTNTQIGASKAVEAQKSAELHDVEGRVAFTASDAFLELVRARNLMDASDRHLTALVNLRTRIELRASSGAANQADVLTAAARVESAQGERIRARTRFAVSQARLTQLTGAPITRVLDPAAAIAKLATGLGGSDGMSGSGVEAATHAAEVARAKVKIAELADLPSIGLRASHTLPIGQRDLSPSNRIGVTVVGDLFNGGASDGKLAAARGELAAAERSVELARLNTATEVAVARAEKQGAAERTAAYVRQRDIALRARETSLAEYEIGRRTLTEVLSAEQEIFRAESDRINAVGDAWIAVARAAAASRDLTGLATRL